MNILLVGLCNIELIEFLEQPTLYKIIKLNSH